MAAQASKPEISYDLDPMDEIFQGDVLSKAKELTENSRKFSKKLKCN